MEGLPEVEFSFPRRERLAEACRSLAQTRFPNRGHARTSKISTTSSGPKPCMPGFLFACRYVRGMCRVYDSIFKNAAGYSLSGPWWMPFVRLDFLEARLPLLPCLIQVSRRNFPALVPSIGQCLYMPGDIHGCVFSVVAILGVVSTGKHRQATHFSRSPCLALSVGPPIK